MLLSVMPLFRQVQLFHSSKAGHVRLGYMGHLTLISEDVIGALEHYPPDLRILLAKYAPQPDWDDYVSGRYHETKVKDTSLLGGGKPVVAPGAPRPAAKWKVDEAEIAPGPGAVPSATNGIEASTAPSDASTTTLKGEFRRTSRLTRETSADFGVAPFEHDEEGDDTGGPSQVSRESYWRWKHIQNAQPSLQAISPVRYRLTAHQTITRMMKTRTADGYLIKVLVDLENLLFQCAITL